MGFNKRYISKKNLTAIKSQGLEYLVKYITNPDCLLIEDDFSREVCRIVQSEKNKDLLKSKLTQIGFYES